jgi:hypothetical protein
MVRLKGKESGAFANELISEGWTRQTARRVGEHEEVTCESCIDILRILHRKPSTRLNQTSF